MPDKKERPDPNKSLVGFVVGSVHYAVGIAQVREIINPTTITQLPHLPSAVAGVADHRGDVIPIIDLRLRFGLQPSSEKKTQTKWILVAVAGKSVALVVDRVTDVFGTGGEEFRPAPTLGTGDEARGISGVISREGTLTFVLDTERLETLTAGIEEGALLEAARAERP